MIFIPFGVNQNDQNRYELTQYINDVTTQNTQVLMEYSNESGITAYTYGNERLSYETNGVNYKYNYDGRGSVTNLLDNNNTSVVEYNYQPFGETEILGTKANELENTYQFNAESTDALTGLQYLRARYYNSKTGRFTSADTYLGEITDPLSRNLYLYTKNDPVNYVDPSGHLFETITKIAQTVQNMVQTAAQKVVETIESSPILSAVKNVVKGAINTVVNKVVNSNAANRTTNNLWTPPAIENNVSFDSSKKSVASTILKIEQVRELEQQIQTYRAKNTKEANEIVTVLEEQMKKLCEDKLDRVELQKAVERIAELETEAVRNQMRKTDEKGFSAVVGFGSKLVLDTIEFLEEC